LAFTALTPQAALPNTASAAIVLGAADAAGDMFLNPNGKISLRIKNGSGSTMTATVQSVPDSYGRSGDLVIAILAGTEVEVGHLDPALFNQRTGNIGYVQVTYSLATSVTVAAVQHG